MGSPGTTPLWVTRAFRTISDLLVQETIPLLPSPQTAILKSAVASSQPQTLLIVLRGLVGLGRLTWRTIQAGAARSLTHQADTLTVITRLSIIPTSTATRHGAVG